MDSFDLGFPPHAQSLSTTMRGISEAQTQLHDLHGAALFPVVQTLQSATGQYVDLHRQALTRPVGVIRKQLTRYGELASRVIAPISETIVRAHGSLPAGPLPPPAAASPAPGAGRSGIGQSCTLGYPGPDNIWYGVIDDAQYYGGSVGCYYSTDASTEIGCTAANVTALWQQATGHAPIVVLGPYMSQSEALSADAAWIAANPPPAHCVASTPPPTSPPPTSPPPTPPPGSCPPDDPTCQPAPPSAPAPSCPVLPCPTIERPHSGDIGWAMDPADDAVIQATYIDIGLDPTTIGDGSTPYDYWVNTRAVDSGVTSEEPLPSGYDEV
jgi:hypothetical protein